MSLSKVKFAIAVSAISITAIAPLSVVTPAVWSLAAKTDFIAAY